jgi:hypothetical protein
MKPFQKVEVSGYSGFRHLEKPRLITYPNKTLAITKIMERSLEELTPSGERFYRFRVLCEDKKDYVLLYKMNTDQWYIST